MPVFPFSPPAPAVLLVLLPLGAGAAARATLAALQQQLGAAVRVLAIDEASHPAVVHSFGPPALPACVLVRQGVELWRQQGLPDAAAVASLLPAA
jgi:thioredoxin-like negative regulator of GroEL